LNDVSGGGPLYAPRGRGHTERKRSPNYSRGGFRN
jgi:hypothetical protein